jgi:hypothetical protein
MTTTVSRTTYLLHLAAGLMLATSPAVAGGSVEIDQVMRLAGQSPKLISEIQSELKEAGKTLSDVKCDAARLGRYWTHLGGLRIPPYTCEIGTRMLELSGAVEFYAEDGTVPDEETRHEVTRYVSETEPGWSSK